MGAHGAKDDATVPTGLDTFPRKILGAQRIDLTDEAAGDSGAPRKGSNWENMITARMSALHAAYGGPGIEALYVPAANGGARYQLLLVNGIQNKPVVAPDEMITTAERCRRA